MANVLERALDPRIDPRWIFRRHPHDELTDLKQSTVPSGSLGVRPLAGNQLAMPPEQRVGRRDCGNLPQGRTADPICSRGQPAAIVIRETQPPSTKLTPQEPILLEQVGDGLPLPAVSPAGQHKQHHLQRGGVDHEPELISWLA
jgi:hypothetical protein